ncbi:hypothetical protein GCM10022206_77370 [Streptomyces chiangmaiensis]
MRIYISVDMEGITGLVDADDVQPGGRDYERGRLMMAEDVNAAIRGAVAAGATDITVNDAHGPMRNLLPEALHPAARLIRGKPKQMLMLEGLAPEHDAAVFVGYHSRAGALGVLSHSFMGHEIEDMWLDGRPVGEIGLAHATAAAIGVPVTVLTGDDCACTDDGMGRLGEDRGSEVCAGPVLGRSAAVGGSTCGHREGGRRQSCGTAEGSSRRSGPLHPHGPLAVGFDCLDAPGHSRRHVGRQSDRPGAGHTARPLSAVRRVDASGRLPDQPAPLLLTAAGGPHPACCVSECL